jgi:glycosyltransferase involved in cell wall biosynthesis
VRIYYDGQNYFPPQGVGRYFKNLIERLPETDVPMLSVTNLQQAHLPRHPHLDTTVGWTVPSLRAYLRFRPLRDVAARQLRWRTRGLRHDVSHPTYYELISGLPIASLAGPVVITVYDMIHELVPELDPTGRVVASKQAALRRADLVICISEHTRADLLSRHALAEDRVVVTHLATDLTPEMADGPEPVPTAPYVLYVGARARYKNFDHAAEAFRRAAEAVAELRLVVVGHRFTAAERQRLQDLGIADAVEHVGQVADAHLAKLYRHAIALVYPSLYEGFGIPPLEAMTCGTAVITSRSSSIPEVVGDAALLVDPNDVDDLASAIRLVATDAATRRRLVDAGAERARLFDWTTTATTTRALYDAIA